MSPPTKSKVICIHHRLAGYSSHHYNEAHGFISLTAFVDLVEAKIALRSGIEKQRCWQFWKRRTQETPILTSHLWE